LISKSEVSDRSDLLSIKKIQENFPYFQIPHVLAARYEFNKDPNKISDSLGYAAITSPNRIWLKQIIEKKSETPKISTCLQSLYSICICLYL